LAPDLVVGLVVDLVAPSAAVLVVVWVADLVDV